MAFRVLRDVTNHDVLRVWLCGRDKWNGFVSEVTPNTREGKTPPPLPGSNV